MTRMGLYLRISDDQDGTQTATQRQRADCEAFATAQGWEIADTFEDVGISAFKRVLRPEFNRLIKAVQAKEIDGVLTWHLDRLSRQLKPYADLMDACQQTDAFVATVADHIDTRTSAGRFVADLLVSHARMSSEDTARRVQRKHLEWAQQGKPQRGGNHRPYGYTKGYGAIIEEEAAHVREAAGRVLAGESLHGICWDFQRRGITTPEGNPWQNVTLRLKLLSAGISGQREYEGVLSPGSWPAIISPEEHLRVRMALRGRTKARTARAYLLTGFARCGKCGHELIARPTAKGMRSYVCAKRPGYQSCGGLKRKAEPLEDYVKQAVLVALDGVDLREYVEKPKDVDIHMLSESKSMRIDEEALATLSKDFYADHLITRAEFFSARDALQGRIEHNRKQLARTNGHGLLNQLVNAGAEVGRMWEAKGLDWQRSVVAALIDHVTIMPTVRGQRTFDPQAVKIQWKF